MQAQLTGTTTASYVSALDWKCQFYVNKTIYLKNTDSTSTLYYKVLAKFSSSQSDANAAVLVAETSLAVGADVLFQYNNEYYELIIQVKDNSGHATYEIDYSSRGN